jgi:hypothetical protein
MILVRENTLRLGLTALGTKEILARPLTIRSSFTGCI